jgi:sialate O-acetylesterase
MKRALIILCLATAAPAQDVHTNLPTLFLIGDSTVNNSGFGQQGWGTPIAGLFDKTKINVVNRARGGRSSRTYYTEGLWSNVVAELKPGDFVIMQFGHNDGGSLRTNRRASLKGTGEETEEIGGTNDVPKEVVHTFGWYLRQYIRDTKTKGATAIVCSLIPRNDWKDGKVLRASEGYGKFAREVAEAEGVAFVDLNEIVARRYEELGQERVKDFFPFEHTHTSPEGAALNAQCVVEGLQALKSPLCAYLAKLPAVKLPSVIASDMVLQRDRPAPIWGWTAPGSNVTVRFAGRTKTARAGADGRWEVRLDPLPASDQPRDMVIDSVTLTNILVGEVWLCCGQSNMEKPIGEQRGQKPVFNHEQELAAANYPLIRLYKAEKTRAFSPAKDVQGSWRVCNSNSHEELKFSAAAYFFGREIFRELKVPVGLVESAWGGTRIEPWTPTFAFTSNLAEFASLEMRTNKVGAAGIYNGMVAPLAPFAIRGALWYQGESNLMDVNDGAIYAEKMKALIAGWRKAWGEGDFPFYYVQLAPYAYHGDRPERTRSAEGLPEIWEAQTKALAITNTGMIVTTDLVDDLHDIHPRNKQEVGRRLALVALAETYGRTNLVCSGPMYKGMEIRGSKIVVSFDRVGGGLVSKDGRPPTWFMIAGADGRFVPAEAMIDGNTVVVSSSEVPEPKSVRFAWHETAQPNLFNKEGLPAVPFRASAADEKP